MGGKDQDGKRTSVDPGEAEAKAGKAKDKMEPRSAGSGSREMRHQKPEAKQARKLKAARVAKWNTERLAQDKLKKLANQPVKQEKKRRRMLERAEKLEAQASKLLLEANRVRARYEYLTDLKTKEDADKNKASHEAGELPDAKTEGYIPLHAEERHITGLAKAEEPAFTNGHAESDDTSSDSSSGSGVAEDDVGQDVQSDGVDDVDVFPDVDNGDDTAVKAETKAEQYLTAREEDLASAGAGGEDMVMIEPDATADDGSKKAKKKSKKTKKTKKNKAANQGDNEVNSDDLAEPKDQDLASSGIKLEGKNDAIEAETETEQQVTTDTKTEGKTAAEDQVLADDNEGAMDIKSSHQKKDKKKKKKQKSSSAAFESAASNEEEPKADDHENKAKRDKKRKRKHEVDAADEQDQDVPRKKEKKAKKEEQARSEHDNASAAADAEPDADASERWNVRGLEGGTARQEKFLKLLGGKKAKVASTSGETTTNGSTPKGASRDRLHMGHVAEDLEKQFQAGVRMKFEQQGQRRGLGA